jgi:hypothetical protein
VFVWIATWTEGENKEGRDDGEKNARNSFITNGQAKGENKDAPCGDVYNPLGHGA